MKHKSTNANLLDVGEMGGLLYVDLYEANAAAYASTKYAGVYYTGNGRTIAQAKAHLRQQIVSDDAKFIKQDVGDQYKVSTGYITR